MNNTPFHPYPLQFKPDFKEKIWGGRSLEPYYNLPDGKIGEAWIISDHPHGSTQIENGAYKGKTLYELMSDSRTSLQALLGTNGAKQKLNRFPLLIKLLDCNDDLSVQVHPDDDYEKLPAGELGKTEMWYVLQSRPGAQIIYGLKDDFSIDQMEEAIRQDRLLDGLKSVHPEPGDSFYIPAGTVHALGKGVVVAEIQQNSDTTYRLYDYNRPGLDGKLRELHIEDSIHVTKKNPPGAGHRKAVEQNDHSWDELARSPYFIVEKGNLDGSWKLATHSDSCEILIACEGNGELIYEDQTFPFRAGSSFLLPAALGAYSLKGKVTMLRSRLP